MEARRHISDGCERCTYCGVNVIDVIVYDLPPCDRPPIVYTTESASQ